jgi:hypothetical protein
MEIGSPRGVDPVQICPSVQPAPRRRHTAGVYRLAPGLAVVVIGLAACGDAPPVSRSGAAAPPGACVRLWNASRTGLDAGALAWGTHAPNALVERDERGRCVVSLDPRACDGRRGGVPFSGAWTFTYSSGRWREILPHPGPRFERALDDGLRRVKAVRHRPNARVASERGALAERA